MSESSSLRPRVGRHLQSSVEQALKRPVKEAVREALADTAQNGDGNVESEAAASRRIEVDPSDVTDAAESASSAADATQAGSRSRLRNRLRSRRTLALGLVALGAYLSRRRSSTRND
ncbi:hypothetical protein [Haloarcula sp. 1CSR25-25]|uniref:hypothetical protein n=1 Tax=Haloarcula sp. 1CSR25-25 TaxID=2862545 RepID=UPI002895496B|nr:hypothetical protein [Haloarcula sp. 1CSR25-25]MDT3433348.1 hypothetical protein [Haloarcula sp. 1CSR25-25]